MPSTFISSIKEQAKVFEAIVENTSEAIYLISPHYELLWYNKIARQRMANILDRDISIGSDFRELVFPGSKTIFHSMFNDALKDIRRDEEIMSSDIHGNNFWFRYKTNPVYDRDKNLIGVVLLSENIDERKMAEQEVLRLSRLYQFISQVNASMLKLETSEDIFKEACRIAVEYGKFTMAWIGIYDEEKGVYPVTWAGNENGFLAAISNSPDFLQTKGVGIAEKVGLSKTVEVRNDIANDEANIKWKTEALKQNYRSCISVPIIMNSNLLAIYTIFASDAFFFNQAEVKLLKEVADNIAYALDKIQMKERHQTSEAQLRESEEKFRKLVEETLVGVFILQDEKFTYANPALEKILGYEENTLIGKSFLNVVHDDDKQRAMTKHRQKIAGQKQSHQYILKGIKSDGAVIYLEAISARIIYLGKPAVIGTLIDITQQLEEEKRISKAVSDAQEMERQQISMELHDNVKQIMAASLLNVDMMPMIADDKKLIGELTERVKNYIKEAIEELRRISHRLAPSIDQDVPLQEKFKTVVNTMNISKEINVTYHFDKINKPLGPDVQLAMYRILQEQLSNILKYAKASDVQIDVHKVQEGISMSIEDNGVGFDTKAKKSGIGLENIKRRVRAFNGKVNIKSSPGHGCRLNVELKVE